MAAQASLELRVEDGGWCHLTVACAGARARLGADSLGVIVHRLRDHLGAHLDAPAVADGRAAPWVCALSLYEDHGSLFLRPVLAGVEFRVQDAAGHTALRFILPRVAAQGWRDTLARWAES